VVSWSRLFSFTEPDDVLSQRFTLLLSFASRGRRRGNTGGNSGKPEANYIGLRFDDLLCSLLVQSLAEHSVSVHAFASFGSFLQRGHGP